MEKSFIKKTIRLVDNIYPLENLLGNIYEIKDHINLSGISPLKGPDFIPLSNIYLSTKGIIVCGLKEGVHPNEYEKKILLKAGVKAYCYHLVPKAIVAARAGLKIKAYGLVQPKDRSLP